MDIGAERRSRGAPRRQLDFYQGTFEHVKAKEELQISAFLGNRPGVIAELCTALAEARVSIGALTVLDTVDVGTLRMVVDNVERATDALKACSAAHVMVPVLSLQLPNRSGAFGEVARIMSDAGVNIEYVYATALPGTDKTLGIFRVNDLHTALMLEYPDE